MLKLHLGCGHKRWDGFVNIDGYSNDRAKPDLVHDLIKPLPYADGTVDEVHAIHLIEHFQRWEVESILADWTRVLKPGGLLVLECPCLDKVLAAFQHFIKTGQPIDARMTIWGLYGDPGHREPAMMHHWCYSFAELSSLMEDAGLQVTIKDAQFHHPVRDMRLEGIKHAAPL